MCRAGVLGSTDRFFELFVEHTQLCVDSADCPIDIVQHMNGLVVPFIH